MPNLLDPSSLTDEELDKLIAGEELPDDVPPVEEPVVPPVEEPVAPPAEGEPVVEPPVEEPPVEEPPAEDPPAPSRREQLRINQLLAKMKQEPASPAPTPTVDPAAINYDELDADPELIKELKADRERAATNGYEQVQKQIQASEWRTMLNFDAPQIESRYAVLNPKDTEHFHPVLANALTQRYLQTVGYDEKTRTVANPSIRWAEFVDSEMELAEEIANSKIATTTTNIKKQAAQTALRPDGSSAKKMNLNQSPETMTDEELDAVIALGIPAR